MATRLWMADDDDASNDSPVSKLTSADALTLHVAEATGVANMNNVRFYSMQKIPREISPGSLTIGRVNQNGLHKLDINMGQQQAGIHEIYHDDAKTVRGLSVRPSVGEWNSGADGASMFEHPRKVGRWIQNNKGLANFSSLKLGDQRIQRVLSAHRETFRAPEDVSSIGKAKMDRSFRNATSPGHEGCGTFVKSFQMSDEVLGDESHSVGPASTHKIDDADNGRRLRLSMYRRANINLGTYRPETETVTDKANAGMGSLETLEKIFRYKLGLKACKGVSQFRLNTMFSYLDRSGRGGFDLEDFRNSLEVMNLDFSEDQAIALFAKFDRGCKGFVSYHDFSVQLGKDPNLDVAEVQRLLVDHLAAAQRNQHLHQHWSAELGRGKSRILKQVMEGELFEDEESVYDQNAGFEMWIDKMRATASA